MNDDFFTSPTGAEAPELPPGTLGIRALAEGIERALRQAFPRRLWVVGETQELERAVARGRPHWFFRLVEEHEERTYALDAVLWRSEIDRLFGAGGKLEGLVEPADGLALLAQVEVSFYAPHGALRLVVRDIDPRYTIGKLHADRRRLVERLRREGVLERQKRLSLPEVPLTIGLVTARNSAAFRDFVTELLRSPFRFRIRPIDARMQGEETRREVPRAIERLSRLGVDVVCVVRGGGSATDLMAFDAEEIARAVAACPVPVLTGIGHEIDESVADLAAYRSFKTPTAAAAFLVERAREQLEYLRTARERLARPVATIEEEERHLSAALERIGRAAPAAVARARRLLAQRTQLFVSRAGAALAAPRERLAAAIRRLDRARLLALVRAQGERVDRAVFALARSTDRLLRSERERVVAAAARARAHDPSRVLRRGFAMLRDEHGRLISDAGSARPGQRISARLRDGEIGAKVERILLDEEDRHAEERDPPGRDRTKGRQAWLFGGEAAPGGDPRGTRP